MGMEKTGGSVETQSGMCWWALMSCLPWLGAAMPGWGSKCIKNRQSAILNGGQNTGFAVQLGKLRKISEEMVKNSRQGKVWNSRIVCKRIISSRTRAGREVIDTQKFPAVAGGWCDRELPKWYISCMRWEIRRAIAVVIVVVVAVAGGFGQCRYISRGASEVHPSYRGKYQVALVASMVAIFFFCLRFHLAPFTGARFPVKKKGCEKIRLWLEAELEDVV
ncbi:hypothetical protein F5144DRAFT_74387 [Chaetomium tenue]|uniref:Uncharacterized protein n=1 Tax=Chaetomium tenue TaxID=1854479 RepID=A0ACB7PPH6_9PEZI|nr:hypothetical protein F5144DRAFT_74387 [Chaetomium globosum]